jgi:hypothetical protein
MHSEETQSPHSAVTPAASRPSQNSRPKPAPSTWPTNPPLRTNCDTARPAHTPQSPRVLSPQTRAGPSPPKPTEEGPKTAPVLHRAPRGGSGGSSPRKSTASHSRSRVKRGEHRATPGGYGGKPPGVAIIGVPTGARNAGSGAPTGDQSTDMNATRKHPLVCQDPITTRSQADAEQRNQLSPPRGRAARWPFSDEGPSGSRVTGRLGRYSMKPRVLLGSRPPLASTTAK